MLSAVLDAILTMSAIVGVVGCAIGAVFLAVNHVLERRTEREQIRDASVGTAERILLNHNNSRGAR